MSLLNLDLGLINAACPFQPPEKDETQTGCKMRSFNSSIPAFCLVLILSPLLTEVGRDLGDLLVQNPAHAKDPISFQTKVVQILPIVGIDVAQWMEQGRDLTFPPSHLGWRKSPTGHPIV